MKICYVNKNFKADSLVRIDQANEIIDDWRSQGYRLTLRQLYYQFVSRDLIPNTEKSYDAIGSLISDARLAGLVDWDAIEDRTRNVRKNPHWDGPQQIVSACSEQYTIDKVGGPGLPTRGVDREGRARRHRARRLQRTRRPCFSCRGYTSQSEMWAGGQRLASYIEEGQTPLIIHLGDHDPSGLDMTRDIRHRLEMFVGEEVKVKRVALNMNQVRQFKLPPNPAKVTDSRFDGYRREFGEKSWELDALSPSTINSIVREAIDAAMDEDLFTEAQEKEERERLELKGVASNWSKAVKVIAGGKR